MTRILVVDDEPQILRALRINLRARGYQALTMQAGLPALDQATQRKPDAVILDLGLPDIDGIDLILELRAVTSAPVIVLSGRTGPGDKIGALDAGADDYVTKPFSMEELLARLRAALRRDGPVPPGQPVAIGRSTVDLAAHLATRDGQQVRLTPTEWRLLEILIRHPGQLVGRQHGSCVIPEGRGIGNIPAVDVPARQRQRIPLIGLHIVGGGALTRGI